MSTGWPHVGTVLVPLCKVVSNMIIKEKTAPLLKSGAVFQNGSRVEPFWLHFFFSAVILNFVDNSDDFISQAHD